MTTTKAKKIAKRSWSFEKFSEVVRARCERQQVAVKKITVTKLQACYDDGVTVADTVRSIAA